MTQRNLNHPTREACRHASALISRVSSELELRCTAGTGRSGFTRTVPSLRAASRNWFRRSTRSGWLRSLSRRGSR